MKRWFSIAVVLLSSASYAQENLGDPDSLKAKLKSLPADTNRVLLLCDIAYTYRFVNVDSTLHFATEALHLSQQQNYKNGIAWANLLIGATYAIRGDVPPAISYYERSIQLADSLHNYIIVSRALANIGWCVFDLQDYHRAIQYFKRSLQYQLKFPGQEQSIITLQMNIGQAYLFIQNLTEAEYYLTQALAWGEEKNPNIGYLLNMFGALRIEQRRYVAADSILSRGWRIIDSLPDKIDKADNRYYLSKLKLAQDEIQKALEYATEAKKFYQSIGVKVDLEKTYKLLSTIESKRGNIQQALDYLLVSNALRDSVHSSKARYGEFLFDQREQEKQILAQQREKELLRANARNQQIIWAGSLFIFIGISAGLSFFVWQKQRSNKKLIALNDELQRKEVAIAYHNDQLKEMNLAKDKLFSIIGHDLRGPLLTLTAFSQILSHHTDNLNKDEIKTFLLDLDKSLRNLLKLLENLLEWSLSQADMVEFKPELFDLSKVLKENQELFEDQVRDKKITMVNECRSVLLINAHLNSINTVIRNLISNAIKFTREGGTITLRAEQVDRDVRVSVDDTGLGISQGEIQKLFKIGIKHSTLGTAKEKGSGLGLVLCKDFVEKNGGAIGVESGEGKGSTFYFTVPITPK